MENNQGSFTATTIRKLRKNPLGILSFAVIAVAALVTVFAYFIATDKTKNANRQDLTIAYAPMGYQQLTLEIPLENYTKSYSIHDLFFGKEIDSEQISIVSYSIDKQKVTYIPFLGEGLQGEKVEIPLDIWTHHHIPINEIEKKYIFQKTYFLGTDSYGRDFFSRLVIGTRISFLIGFVAVFISLVVGISLGALAGYYRGWLDNLIMWLINVVWSIPTLLLVIAITLAIGKGFWQIFIAVGLTMWVEVARVVRGQFISFREKEFVEAARALGFSDYRIIFHQILPNVIAPVIVISAANFASAILVESGLSFLGIGAQPPTPSWGNIIKEHYSHIILGKQHLAILPGLAIMFLVLGFNIFGNVLRDVMDIKD
ncbi:MULTISPECIES: ABC transporter permease [Weeksella]|uniref:Binding-protein-dependent transport systems inner membrane component n=1 Tax=Weeksella virosa (strain ATCC 43766 / DSM 16922 / JCM 21250 / CCUG 30538 / CDC 9751 / IAM 14551 / NBRC 16016 / NCTC 11634 / CL345/78) TaxID=865938 RepID=F0NXY2_WEEVC|nr:MULTISPECIES: ABC transporter permease [Weeksella]ADX68050.1 binding-protein-dependent transport systems inner membrane component [Weeksella virosa DSM 16922]MDK7374967.1 ABC transporter permease [Weeksella virosa]MDK7675389.1 ABC transporter permease [Weeksella virosa]OFM83844.1 peptide transporter [Weeksella sp. HMSC059D05]VEH64316.1 Glutathione transport system permease protein gsiD [Weeksella virosa]